jgi:hypothetical protein
MLKKINSDVNIQKKFGKVIYTEASRNELKDSTVER